MSAERLQRGGIDPAPGGLRLATPGGPRDSITAWLDVLVKLLRLPGPERAGVREELDTHLRERVRDLMVTGLSEVEASERAIAELGDMAGLAQRFNRAARPVARRRLMNLGMLAAVGVGLIGGAVAFTGPREDRIAVAVFEPEVTKEAAQAAAGRFTVPQGATWAQFFEAAGKGAGLPVMVNWGQLSTIADGQLDANQRATVTGDGLTLPEAMAMANEGLESADDGIDYRVHDGRLEFSSAAHFDKRETVLATYDLAGIIEARLTDPDPSARHVVTEQVGNDVARLLMTLVYPEQWQDNGGDRAKLAVFGPKLFITAPKRFHPKVRWVLGELPTTAEVQEPARAPRTRAATERDLKALHLQVRIHELQVQIMDLDAKRIESGRQARDQRRFTPEILKEQDALGAQRAQLAAELDQLESEYSALWGAGSNQRDFASLERRAKAAQLKLEAIHTELAQLEPMRERSLISATEAARRRAELMQEEAEVLDMIAQIDSRRAELTGKPIVEGGSVRPDGVLVDEQGRPVQGAEVRMEPWIRVLPSEAPASGRQDTAVFHPQRLGPSAMREVLGQALNIIPELKEAPVRTLSVDESDGVLAVTAPVEQLEPIGRIVRAMDLPRPPLGGDKLITRTLALRSMSAAVVAQLIELAYRSRPDLEREFEGHSVSVSERENAIFVTSRPGHVEFIAEFAETLDAM